MFNPFDFKTVVAMSFLLRSRLLLMGRFVALKFINSKRHVSRE